MGTGGALVAVLILLGGAPSAAPLPGVDQYVGSNACGTCHPERFRGWQESYHFAVVQDPRTNPEAVVGDFSQEGVDIELGQVEFTIGGHWYQRYAVELAGETYVLPNTWSVASHRWETQDDWSWRKKPYRIFCIGCHSVRYDPATRSSAEHAVGCEACHGPGRLHSETLAAGDIVNPQHWSVDEQDLLCASCHVRGLDTTGVYHFAVGYIPGGNLTDHYTPHQIQPDETPRTAFLRTFREWKSRLGKAPPPACDVCGMDSGAQITPVKTVTAQCLECHDFGAEFSSHTRHPGQLKLECLDCHRQRVNKRTAAAADVHFPEYFRVHRETTFDLDLARACVGCHAELPLDEVNRQLSRWDHSNHDRID